MLSLMIKPVSGACNMRCSYCFYLDEMAKRETASFGLMNNETASTVISRAFAYAQRSVCFVFQGGEPTLAEAKFYRRWMETVRRRNPLKLRVQYALQTNGYFLAEEMLDVLKEGDFLVGVSLDGTKEIHDSRRKSVYGSATFEQITRNIAELRQRGIAFNILCVVDQTVASQASQVYEALRRYGYLQFIPCLEPLGKDGGSVLDPEKYGNFLIELFDCYARDFLGGRYVSISLFDNWIRMLNSLPPTACGMNGVCSSNYMVESNGNVYPCDFYALDEWQLGNLLNDSLFSIAKSVRMKSFLAGSPAVSDSCRECAWHPLCKGGCKRDRQACADDLTDINRLCVGYKIFFESRHQQLSALARHPAKNLPRQM